MSTQTSRKLDEERGTLEASNDELKAAEHKVAELTAQLDDQHERAESAEARVVEMEGKLDTLDTASEGFVRAREERSLREKWLLDNANDLEERMQQLQIDRDKVNYFQCVPIIPELMFGKLLRHLQGERQAADELALAHSTLQHQFADITQQLQSAKDAEVCLQEAVHSLEQRLSGASEALAECERQCQVLEELQVVSEHALNDLWSRDASGSSGTAVAESSATMQGAHEEVARLSVMLEIDEYAPVRWQHADLEMKNVQLTKTQNQLEDDNAGLYIGLEAKRWT